MVTIRQLLEDHQAGEIFDRRLSWGAKVSDYRAEIAAELKSDHHVVLIELDNQHHLFAEYESQITVIDHHGPLAGHDKPTALEQVFSLLRLPAAKWSRWFELVSANDRGHIRGMLEVKATAEEVAEIRLADRKAQGVTAQQEAAGREAILQTQVCFEGELTIVTLSHNRTAVVTDLLSPELGGTGYQNLIVICPNETMFYGQGKQIRQLVKTFPEDETFYGGNLDENSSEHDYGFWGRTATMIPEQFHFLFTNQKNNHDNTSNEC